MSLKSEVDKSLQHEGMRKVLVSPEKVTTFWGSGREACEAQLT